MFVTSDVQISDDKKLLVVSTEGGVGSILIYDRTLPTHPTLLKTFTSATTSTACIRVKLGRIAGRLYAFLQIDPNPVLTDIVDITDPLNPIEISTLVSGTPLFVHDVFFKSGLLFVGEWDEGMRIFDIGAGTSGGSVQHPVEIGFVLTKPGQDSICSKNKACAPHSEVHNIYWFNDPVTGSKKYAFVGQEGSAFIPGSASGDVHVVDVSDMAHPKEVAFYSVPGAGTHNFAVDEANGILYAAYYNGGVRALDIRGDLGTCDATQKVADGRCDLRLMHREAAVWLPSQPVFIWGVALVGDKLYASDMISGLWKLDVSNVHL